MSEWTIAALGVGGLVYTGGVWWMAKRIHGQCGEEVAEKRRYALGCPSQRVRFRLEAPERYYTVPEWSPVMVRGQQIRADEVVVGDLIAMVRSDGSSDRGQVVGIEKLDTVRAMS